MHPLERVVIRSLIWLGLGLLAAIPLLIAPQVGPDQLLLASTAHLSALVALGIAATVDLSRGLDQPGWFETASEAGRKLGSATTVVAVVTGVVALSTLATSAAMRFQPSLQFLQLLSALDIAWVAAALYIGVRWMWSRNGIALMAASALGIVCVWSIWNYLNIVGFTSDGGWLVDGSALVRLVIPVDMAAAAVAVGFLIAGSRRAARLENRT